MLTDSSRGETTGLSRWAAVGFSLLLLASVAIVGVAAASSTGAAANSTSSNPIEFTYVNDSTSKITAVRQDGTQLTLDNSSSAVALGPARNLDNDSAIEIPYVDSNNELRVIDTNGEDVALGPTNASKEKSKVATGDWNDNGQTGIVYATTNNEIYHIENGSDPVRVLAPDDNTDAVVGVADITGDNETEIIYEDGSDTLHYYNSSGDVDITGIGETYGVSAGEPADFNGDGTLRIPVVTGAQQVGLAHANGTVTTLTSGDKDRAPVAAANWTGDSDPEVLYLDSSNIHYVTLNGTTGIVSGTGGNQLSASQEPGIAAFHTGPTPLNVSNFTLTNSTGQNVTVSFDSNEELSSTEVDLSGAENATLTRSDFVETDSYTYTATYEGSTDGNYTATLDYTESMDGDRFDQNLTDSTVVDALAPTVVSANVSDADDNGIVGPGEQFTVTANVSGDTDLVTANLSAFGAGDVSESVDLDGGETTVNFTDTVDASRASADGNYSVEVVAEDDEGNADSATNPQTLTLDTTPPSVDAGDDRNITEGDTVNFSATASDENGIDSYEWAFGTGDSDTGQSTSFTYDTPGNHTVTLEVTDNAGNTASDTLTVAVEQAVSASGSSDGSTSDSSHSGSSASSSTDDDGGPTGSTPTSTPTTTPTSTSESTETPTATAREAPHRGTPAQTPTETPTPTVEQTDESVAPVPAPTEAGAAGAGFLAILLVLVAARVVQRSTSVNSS